MRTARVLRLAAALTLLPLAVSALYLLVRHGDYTRVGDLSMTEMVTRDVGGHAIAIGPFSRDGWHHPGPALYYVLAGPYRLLGSTAAALDVGALLINAAAVAGMALVARRRGDVGLALVTLVGCALLMRSFGPDEVRLPWNPYVTVLPYALLLFLTWALTCRDRWALPVAVGVASFVAQTHIGYVALALPVLAFGVGWLVVSTLVVERSASVGARLRPLLVPGLIAAAVGTVMWLPPLVQQVTGDPGNLQVAFEWFRGGGSGEEAAGAATGWRLVAGQYTAVPEWLVGQRQPGILGEPPYLYGAMVVPVLLPVVAAAAWVLWRLRSAGAGRLVAVWLVGSAVGVVATARTVGPVFEYRVGWARVLAMVGGVIVGWAGWTALARARPDLERRLLVPLSLAVLAVLALVGSVAHVGVGRPQPEESARLAAVVPDVVDGLPPGSGPVVVDGRGTFEAAVYGPGLVLRLERRGIDARMPAGDAAAGGHRMDDGGPTRADLVVTTGEAILAVEGAPGARLLSFDGDLTLEELRAEVTAGEDVPNDAALAVFVLQPFEG